MNMNNANMPMDVNAMGMMDFSMGAMPLMGGDPSSGFMEQLQDGGNALGLEAINDLTAKNRNRGNYRCSKCGEPKKGHVCPLVPSNFKCNRCGLSKKNCTCVAPSMRTIGVQVEMDEDMTTRVLDLSLQGVVEFHKTVVGYTGTSPPTTS